MKFFKIRYCFILILPLIVLGCGESSSGTDSDTTLSTSDTVPTEVVVASPSAQVATNNSALKKGAFKLLTGDPAALDPLSKIEALEALVAGNDDCAFTWVTEAPESPECYGPKINESGTFPDSPQTASYTAPPFDLGPWNESEGEEACAAAQLNYLIDSTASVMDNAIRLFASSACSMKKAGTVLPSAGESFDIASALESNLTIVGQILTIDSATIEAAQTNSGDTSFTMTLQITYSDGGGLTAILTHIPNTDDPTLYRGKLSTVVNFPSATIISCQNRGAGEGYTFGSVILYNKSSETSLVEELKTAHYCGGNLALEEVLDENNNLDFTDTFNTETQLGWVENGNYALLLADPTTGNADIQYAWQAGFGDGASRAFNASLTNEADGSGSGYAFYGFGAGLDAAGNEIGNITGMVCNWAGPGNDGGVGKFTGGDPFTLYQPIVRDPGTSAFKSDTPNLAITYAPTNSCSSPGSFIYSSTETTQDGKMTNDNPTGKAVTHNLKPLTFYEETFTPLEPPEDI